MLLLQEGEGLAEGRAREQLEVKGATTLLRILSPQAGERDSPLCRTVSQEIRCVYCRARARHCPCPHSGPSPRATP